MFLSEKGTFTGWDKTGCCERGYAGASDGGTAWHQSVGYVSGRPDGSWVDDIMGRLGDVAKGTRVNRRYVNDWQRVVEDGALLASFSRVAEDRGAGW